MVNYNNPRDGGEAQVTSEWDVMAEEVRGKHARAKAELDGRDEANPGIGEMNSGVGGMGLETGGIDMEVGGASPETMGLDAEVFNVDKCREVMNSIAAPTDTAEGVERVMESLTGKHELRILGFLAAGAKGFDNYDMSSKAELLEFTRRYPSPEKFDEAGEAFLDMIGRLNGPKKRTQYETAMESFKQKVFGAKQVYYEQMKILGAWERTAEEAGSEMDRDGFVPFAAVAGQSARDDVSEVEMWTPNEARAFMQEHMTNRVEQGEIERGREWTPGTCGWIQASRAQVVRGVTGEQIYDGMEIDPGCQDAWVSRPDKGFYGVFDGAGGYEGGHEASAAAARVAEGACDRYNLRSGADLGYVINSANSAVREATHGQGYTTATLAQVVPDGQGGQMLAYASVGDSRIYVMGSGGDIRQITQDEGEGSRITNALGVPGDDRVRQYGEIPLAPGDRVMMCSDGITGDFEPDLVSDEEIRRIMMRADDPSRAAEELLLAARKKDDRTVLCFGV